MHDDSLVAETVKNPPAMSREDPLEKGMATHSSILAWKISWTEKPCGLVYGVAREVDMTA